jgi:hypothetical protein
MIVRHRPARLQRRNSNKLRPCLTRCPSPLRSGRLSVVSAYPKMIDEPSSGCSDDNNGWQRVRHYDIASFIGSAAAARYLVGAEQPRRMIEQMFDRLWHAIVTSRRPLLALADVAPLAGDVPVGGKADLARSRPEVRVSPTSDIVTH